MGKYDKDRYQKELAVRYCLARRVVPFLEVNVSSVSDLSDSPEVLTDIDVLGVESVGDGDLRRTLFDCKTSNKMSSVNRGFWAAGVKEYTGCNEAYVILRNKAVHNHKISALSIDVDLHDEQSFKDLGLTIDTGFPADDCYQASIDRWNVVYECYERNVWTKSLFDQMRNVTPITRTPWKTFRRLLADLRTVRGEIDPTSDRHLAIFFDILASTFVLWAALGRDIRRFYEPTISRLSFETVLKYYLWGGKEAYNIRQQLRERVAPDVANPPTVELPAWESLVSFVGIVVPAPQSIFGCAHICREFSMKLVCGPDAGFDSELARRLVANTRARQFTVALGHYLVDAGGLPKELGKRAQGIVFAT